MELLQQDEQEFSPYTQILILLGYVLAGALVTTVVAMAIISAMYGVHVFIDPEALSGARPEYIPALKIMQTTVFIGVFLAPPVLLAVTEKKRVYEFYQFKKPQAALLALVLLVMAVSMPFMEYIALLNQKMSLPESLRSVENWMRQKEDEAMNLTYLFLRMDNIGELVINLFMIAILPGIAEELIFRGALQRSFKRMFHNPHVAIWLAAFIFSLIHVQFYGFLPRLLLGAGFGYIYYWSGSLWYAMFAHFLNNAYAVSVAWYLQRKSIPLNEETTIAHFPWWGYAVSLIATVFLFIYFRNKTKGSYGKQLD